MTENEAVAAAQAVADKYGLKPAEPTDYSAWYGIDCVWADPYEETSWHTGRKTKHPGHYPVKLWVGEVGKSELGLYVGYLRDDKENQAKTGVKAEPVFGIVDISPKHGPEPGTPAKRVERIGLGVMANKLSYAKDLTRIEETLAGRKAHANVSLDSDLSTVIESMGFDTKLNDELKIERWEHAKYPKIEVEERVRSNASVPTKFLELKYNGRGLAKLDLPITAKRMATFKTKVDDVVRKAACLNNVYEKCKEIHARHFSNMTLPDYVENAVTENSYYSTVDCSIPAQDDDAMTLSIDLMRGELGLKAYNLNVNAVSPEWLKVYIKAEAFIAEVRAVLKELGVEITEKPKKAKEAV